MAASDIWQKDHGQPLVIIFIFFFLMMNLITLFTAGHSYSHRKKIAVVDFTKKYVTGGNYNLEALGECPRFAGWRYLFEYYHHRPNSSYMDSYFGWLYQDKNETSPAEKIVLLSMIDPRSSNNSIETWQKEKISFLSRYSVITQKLIDNIHVFILAPKK